MPRFLLDTNACIQIIKGRTPSLQARLANRQRSDIAICATVWSELLVGPHLSKRGYAVVRAEIDRFSYFTLIPFDRLEAEHHAEIRAYLQSRGQLIGERDMQIAACARAHGLIVVTHNTHEFSRVPGLNIEDWEIAA
ncbi:MAG: PIN domain-containing protein [Candidatus Methylumidiphilus sp.]